jgi:hypothetical protein
MIDPKDTEAQLFTWELKEQAWREVAHLPLAEAFRERRRRSAETMRVLGFEDRVRDPRSRAGATGTRRQTPS